MYDPNVSQGRPVLLVDRRAREAEEAGVRQRLAQVGGEPAVLGPVRLVGEHEDVAGGRQQRDTPRVRAAAWRIARRLELLELLHGRQDRLPRRPREQLAQVAHALGPLGVGEAAGDEGLGDLLVEVLAVGDDHERRVLVRRVAPELQREPQHREALARALRVPDDAAALGRASSRSGARAMALFTARELLVAAELADGAPGRRVALEHDEVADEVEEVRGRAASPRTGSPARWACARGPAPGRLRSSGTASSTRRRSGAASATVPYTAAWPQVATRTCIVSKSFGAPSSR